MRKTKSSGTKMRLLAAASDVFGEKGFRDTTVAEICSRAGANISAVNYYFGSKEILYQESWRHSFSQAIAAHPQDGGVSADAPAAERLRGQIKALIERIADENNRDFIISHMEFISPTGLLAEVMKTELIPLHEKTLAVVRELLGAEVSEQSVHFCETSIISMCVHPMVIQRVRQRTKTIGGLFVISDIEAFADHVLQFALAGIARIGEESSQTCPAAQTADAGKPRRKEWSR